MPMQLSTYIQTKLSSPSCVTGVQTLLKKMLAFAPSNLDTRRSIYFSAHYEEKICSSHEITKIMTWMAERIFYPILLKPDTIHSCLSFWKNVPIEKQETQRNMYIVHSALVFSLTGLGNCSNRSAYAALELFEVLKNTDVQVKIHSWPEIDQYVVMLGNDREGWKIYDPLTNPEILFAEEEYVRDVKSLFQRVSCPKNAIRMTINSEIVAMYNDHLGKIARFLSNEAPKTRLEFLKSDSNYQVYLMQNNISDPAFQKTEEAYEHICVLLGWEDPQSRLNNGLI